MSEDLSPCTNMTSDYIYIFCIPSSSGARLSASEYCVAGSSIQPDDEASPYTHADNHAVRNDPLNCPLSKRVECPMSVSQPRSRTCSDVSNDQNHQLNEYQCTVPSDVITEDLGSHHPPRSLQVQSPVNSDETGLCTLELSPSMLTPNSREVLSPSADSFLLRTTEPWVALPPYSPSIPRAAMRRNIRRSARINLDGSRCPRRSRRTGRLFLISATEEGDKQCCSRSCCLRFLMTVTSFRWILLFFALIGVSCILSGIVLGSLHMAVGNSFLTLSIMFIGLGVLLVVVIGIGWRCTPSGHEPCHLLFNLGDHLLRTSSSRDRHLRRLHSHNSDHNQWFGGIIYPEFEYRTPPPSYSDSVQDQNQVQHSATVHSTGVGSTVPDSPPPAYRSETGSTYAGTHMVLPRCGESSQPPSYRRLGHHHTPSESIAPETVPVESQGSPLYLDTVHCDLDSSGDQHSLAVVKVLTSSECHERLSLHRDEMMMCRDAQMVQLSLPLQPSSLPGPLSSSDADLRSVHHQPGVTDESRKNGMEYLITHSAIIETHAPIANIIYREDDATSVNSDHFTIDIAV